MKQLGLEYLEAGLNTRNAGISHRSYLSRKGLGLETIRTSLTCLSLGWPFPLILESVIV